MPRTYNPEYSRRHYREHTARYREINWRRIVTAEGKRFTGLDYDRAYQIQEGRCKICRRHSTEFGSRLAVDHDHSTGRFRGLLCLTCNTRLGMYENAARNAAFSSYLNGGI